MGLRRHSISNGVWPAALRRNRSPRAPQKDLQRGVHHPPVGEQQSTAHPLPFCCAFFLRPFDLPLLRTCATVTVPFRVSFPLPVTSARCLVIFYAPSLHLPLCVCVCVCARASTASTAFLALFLSRGSQRVCARASSVRVQVCRMQTMDKGPTRTAPCTEARVLAAQQRPCSTEHRGQQFKVWPTALGCMSGMCMPGRGPPC